MLSKLILITSLFLGALAPAGAAPIDQQYPQWNALLARNVHWLPDQSQSRVNYAALKAEHAQLKAVLGEMSAVSQGEFDLWPQPQQMAFLINAYNAYTLELIVAKYPDLHSIKDLGSLIQSPWKKKFFTLLGAERNLDWIENDMLRARYKDPRVHVGINCASIGCPALRNEAYSATRLEAQLDDSMARFLSDKTRNRYRDGKLEVSEIFKWFGEDFQKGNKGLRQVSDLFARYPGQLAPDAAGQAAIRAKQVPVTFLTYDWSLNDVR